MKFIIIAVVSIFALSNSSWAADQVSQSSDYIETQVAVTKLNQSQMMSFGSTLPGKLYRVSEGKSCVLSMASVTKTRSSSGFFSTSSSTEAGLPLEAILQLKQIVDRLLALNLERPELFAAIKDEKKNIDLTKLSAIENSEINQLAQSARAALDTFCGL